MNKFKQKFFSSQFLYPVALCYIALCFPLIASLNQYLEMGSNIISLIYRATAFIIAILIISREIFLKANLLFTKSMYFLLAFWFYYIFKFIIDLFILDLILDPIQNSFYYFTQGVCIGFINMVAAYLIGRKLDTSLFNKLLLILFSIINVILGITFIAEYGYDIAEYASVRVSLSSENTDINYLNPISIGVNGAYLLVSLLYLKKFKWYHFILLLFGIFNLVISASKGPLLALFSVLFAYYILNLKLSVKMLFKLLCGIVIILLIFNSPLFETFTIFQRITGGGEESTDERTKSIMFGFEQIARNPFFGTHYFVLENNSSPHNIFIDIVLSTGIIGLFLFCLAIFNFLIKVYKRITYMPIMAFGLFTFTMSQTSGYVFGSADFWVFLGLILAYNHKNSYNVKTELNSNY